jgi:hypothetical protein
MKEALSTATTSAGLLFVMWLFFYLPTFHGSDVGMRIGAAGIGARFAMLAFQSGKLATRLERCTLILSASIGVAVVIVGLIIHFLR